MTRRPNLPPRFLILWAGQLLSRIGSGISAFALGVHLFRESGSTAAYSMLLLCAFLPSVVLAPIGGVLADRNDRRLLVALGDFGSALGILFVLLMLELQLEHMWPVYLGVALSSAFVALHAPAFKAFVTELLDEEDYARASGLIQLAEASRYLCAPVIAVFLLARWSLSMVLAIDVATFAVAVLTVLALPRGLRHADELRVGANLLTELGEGLSFVWRNATVTRLLGITTVVTFLTGILQALFAPLLLSLTDAATLGVVQSLAAAGMVASSAWIGVSSRTDAQQRVLAIALAIAGCFYLLIGVTTRPVLIAGAAFCFSATLPFVNTSLEVLFRKTIDEGMQARAWSLISLVSQTGMLIGFAVAGILADRVFNPLLVDGGAWARSIGRLVGTGAGRGSGFLVLVAGSVLLMFGLRCIREARVRACLAVRTPPTRRGGSLGCAPSR